MIQSSKRSLEILTQKSSPSASNEPRKSNRTGPSLSTSIPGTGLVKTSTGALSVTSISILEIEGGLTPSSTVNDTVCWPAGRRVESDQSVPSAPLMRLESQRTATLSGLTTVPASQICETTQESLKSSQAKSQSPLPSDLKS